MKTPLKTTSLDKMIDDHIGKRGMQKREVFESELEIKLARYVGKQARQKRK